MTCDHPKPTQEEMEACDIWAKKLAMEAGTIAIMKCQAESMVFILNQPAPKGMREHEVAAARASAICVVSPVGLIDATKPERELLQELVIKSKAASLGANLLMGIIEHMKTAKTAQNN